MTASPKTLVIIPALNEATLIGGVVRNIRAALPSADVLVINDGSSDTTGSEAENAGAMVLHMPYRVGIGAGVQTGFMFAVEQGYEVVIRNDGDDQHDPADLPRLLETLQNAGVDMVVGSRHLERRGYLGTLPRRVGSALLAGLISTIIGQRITDPTSGCNGFGRRAIELCARVYPHDYPEPETIVMVHRAGLTLREIPVTMKPRGSGHSSITALRSAYYMFKVTLAILIDLLRRAPALNGNT